MLVKPAPNPAFDDKAKVSKANSPCLLVYDPVLRDYLPVYGRDVGEDHWVYWHRLKVNGDVVEVTAADLNSGMEAEAARMRAVAAEDAKAAEAAAAAPQPGVTVQKPVAKAPAASEKKPGAGAGTKES